MLTRKQHELLVFIHRRLAEGGISPSFDEMKEALGLKSKSGIHRLIGGLEERGFLRRLPHRARALEVLRLPDGMATDTGPGGVMSGADKRKAPLFRPEESFAAGADGSMAGPVAPAANTNVQHGDAPGSDGALAVSIPLYGRIAAGLPIEALAQADRFADVPASLIGRGDHYALEVSGDSMVDAGIQDGDTVIIQRGDTAENGQIVVALVEEEEVTLKRLQRRGGTVSLIAENPAYPPREYPADRVRVQGRLVGLMRRY